MDELELHDIQGLVRHGYRFFDLAAYCLLRIDDVPGARRWMAELRKPLATEPWIDAAALRAERLREDDCGVALAFTARGLRTLGLPAPDLGTFVTEFQEGMAAQTRSRMLGDVGRNDPAHWKWGGNPDIDALLIVFAGPFDVAPPQRQQCLDAAVAQIRAIPGCPVFLRRIDASLNVDPATQVTREPFGFADGISQPYVRGLTLKTPPPGTRLVQPGEFVLGYRNEIGRFPASPSVQSDPRGRLPRDTAGRPDFGRNGTFLVMRQLEQDVAAFDGFVGTNAELAARLVGRWRSGEPLVRFPDRPIPGSQREIEGENGFGYHHEDRHGFRCPVGAHIRRANPRDSLADNLGIDPQLARQIADQHRLLRRGRVYRDRRGRQGLVFICLNASIERQFEFVQSSWLLHSEFGGLSGEVDALLGEPADANGRCVTFQNPLLAQRVEGLQRYVKVRGGAYFFLPGRRALNYLIKLP